MRQRSLTATDVVRLDVATGQIDLIVTRPGPSGPVAFDSSGDLDYGESDASFPAQAGAQAIWRFASCSIDGAVGPTSLTIVDATPFALNQTAPSGFAFDAEGNRFST